MNYKFEAGRARVFVGTSIRHHGTNIAIYGHFKIKAVECLCHCKCACIRWTLKVHQTAFFKEHRINI